MKDMCRRTFDHGNNNFPPALRQIKWLKKLEVLRQMEQRNAGAEGAYHLTRRVQGVA